VCRTLTDFEIALSYDMGHGSCMAMLLWVVSVCVCCCCCCCCRVPTFPPSLVPWWHVPGLASRPGLVAAASTRCCWRCGVRPCPLLSLLPWTSRPLSWPVSWPSGPYRCGSKGLCVVGCGFLGFWGAVILGVAMWKQHLNPVCLRTSTPCHTATCCTAGVQGCNVRG